MNRPNPSSLQQRPAASPAQGRDRTLPSLSLLRRAGQTGWRTVRDVVTFMLRRARDEKLFQVASSLTFTTTLSLVPLATTIFGVMTALPVFNRLRDALHSFFESRFLPDALSRSIFTYIDQFSLNASSLTIVSVIGFAITTLATMLTIDRALNVIWRVPRPRPLPQRLVTYWAIITVGPILLGVSLTLAGYLARASAGLISAPPPLMAAAFDLVPLALFTAAYAALYVFVPNRRVEWRDALVGAFFAALAFEAAKRGFAIYVTRFATFTMVYGTLAAVPLLLLWIYYIWIVTLAGALIAASLPALYGRAWNRDRGPGDLYGDALRILRALYAARRSDRRGRLPGLDSRHVGRVSRVDYETVEIVLGKLEQDGIVIRTRPIGARRSKHARDDDLWLFAADASMIPLERVSRLFAFDPDHVATTAFDDDDPLAAFIRTQRLQHDDVTLEAVFADGEARALADDARSTDRG